MNRFNDLNDYLRIIDINIDAAKPIAEEEAGICRILFYVKKHLVRLTILPARRERFFSRLRIRIIESPLANAASRCFLTSAWQQTWLIAPPHERKLAWNPTCSFEEGRRLVYRSSHRTSFRQLVSLILTSFTSWNTEGRSKLSFVLWPNPRVPNAGT